MQITKQNNNQNFTSIYRVRNLGARKAKKVVEMLDLNKKDLKETPINTFVGANPHESNIQEFLKFRLGGYKEFIISKAEDAGIILPKSEDSDLWIFTGKKDSKIPNEVLVKEKGFKGFINNLKNIFLKDEDEIDVKSLDEDIQIVGEVVNLNNRYNKNFEKVISKHNVEDIRPEDINNRLFHQVYHV